MSDGSEHPRLPRGLLLGAAAVVALTLVAAATSRVTGVGRTENPTSTAVEQRMLRFEDRPDGAVVVWDAEAGEAVHVLAPGTNGFVRGVLRGLTRERKLRGVGREPAFQLTRWADGRLSLQDPSTGRVVELGVFGPTNAEPFVEILMARADPD